MEVQLDKKAPGVTCIDAVAAHTVEKSCESTTSEDANLCWICLDCSGPLIYPCKCPRTAHPRCLARWQLQSAGTRKETHCEFCDSLLPDWKKTLTPQSGANAPAVMNVNFDGRTYSFEVKPGPDGYRQFTEAIRRAFSLPEDSELNITFTCDEPSAEPTSNLLTLQGAGAYDAAVHCASVSAARRMLTPSVSRTASQASEMMTSLPSTPLPVSPRGAPTSPADPFGAYEGGSGGGGASTADATLPRGSKRCMNGLRRLRSALSDLLSPRVS